MLVLKLAQLHVCNKLSKFAFNEEKWVHCTEIVNFKGIVDINQSFIFRNTNTNCFNQRFSSTLR